MVLQIQFGVISTTRVFSLLSLHAGGFPAFFSSWLLTPRSPDCSAWLLLLRENQSTHVCCDPLPGSHAHVRMDSVAAVLWDPGPLRLPSLR